MESVECTVPTMTPVHNIKKRLATYITLKYILSLIRIGMTKFWDQELKIKGGGKEKLGEGRQKLMRKMWGERERNKERERLLYLAVTLKLSLYKM